ncbi:MAG: hypothetical protein ACOCVF_00270 [bacterium]
MAFIDEYDPILLNIKITSKGRELLSKGELNFHSYAFGDSDINYNYIDEPENIKILRPIDYQPKLLSYIKESETSENLNEIHNVASIPMIIKNEARSIGFFNLSGATSSIKNDENFIVESELLVNLSSSSGNTVNLIQGSVSSDAEEGDILMIVWGNDNGNLTSINPAPILFYKIVEIDYNGGIITVDRNLPNFIGDNPECHIIMSHERYTTEYRQYAVNYLSESTLTFHTNYEEYGDPFPLWNLNIVYTKDVAGVGEFDKKHTEYKSIKYAGFKSYVELQENERDVIGIVHYSNPSPYNEYGEYFHRDFEDNTPSIYLPTVMWHKSPTRTMGLILTTDVERKTITNEDYDDSLIYYDLIDSTGYVVGKVFPNYKMFVIEDAELLFALSYKSDRNWTLPNFDLEFSDGYGDCGICLINIDSYETETNVIDGDTFYDLTINLSGISAESNGNIIVEVNEIIEGDDNVRMYFEPVSLTPGTGSYTVTLPSNSTYELIVHDRGIADCSTTETIDLT